MTEIYQTTVSFIIHTKSEDHLINTKIIKEVREFIDKVRFATNENALLFRLQ